MNRRSALQVIAALAMVTAGVTAWVYPSLPPIIPIHWNGRGEVDGWGSKATLWLYTGLQLLPFLVLLASGRMFKKRDDGTVEDPEETQRAGSVFHYVLVIVSAMFVYLLFVNVEAARFPHLPVHKPLIGGILFFLALIGNVLGQVKRNRWVGVRTPWTLSSDAVWTATNRLAGRLLFWFGILGAIAIWMNVAPQLVFMGLIGISLISVGYSWLLYQRLADQ